MGNVFFGNVSFAYGFECLYDKAGIFSFDREISWNGTTENYATPPPSWILRAEPEVRNTAFIGT